MALPHGQLPAPAGTASLVLGMLTLPGRVQGGRHMHAGHPNAHARVLHSAALTANARSLTLWTRPPLAALTSVAGAPLVAEEQDLSGFDSSTNAAHAGGIPAAWQPQLGPGQEEGPPGATRKRLPTALRLPWRGTSTGSGGDACEQQPPDALSAGQQADTERSSAAAGRRLQRSATLPSLPLGSTGGGAAGGSAAGGAAGTRRPPGASLLQLPHLPGAAACEAETPTLFGPAKARSQQQQQQQPVRGLPPETWTPIDLQEVGGWAAACLLAWEPCLPPRSTQRSGRCCGFPLLWQA